MMKKVICVALCAALCVGIVVFLLSWQNAVDRAVTAADRAADARVAQEWATERDRQAADREWLLDHPDPERGASLE